MKILVDKYQDAEVDWYLKNGRYADRIRAGSHGRYVAGDYGWNRANPDRYERIEPMMNRELLPLASRLARGFIADHATDPRRTR
jgi:hypothetical protein